MNRKQPLAENVSGIVGCRDLNQDGMDDVVLVDAERASLRVFLARGNGQFKEKTPAFGSFPSPLEPLELAFFDANGDGRTDICVGTVHGDLHVLLGDERGVFPEDRVSVVFAGAGLEAIETADLDGDGRDDVLASVDAPGLVILSSKGK